ncbi:MAG: hypothetical protein LBL37_05370 [Gracilibacteraceae bacterium]|jgi:hypothetical protein|nr:hypothetical protein [Gracilibacteraceae bacterium]
MRCENCYTENAADAEYCTGCGERLTYDEEFFKRENEVDALPKLRAKVRPIKFSKPKGGWRGAAARRLVDALDKAEEAAVAEGKPRGKFGKVVAFLFVAALIAALVFSRVLR